MVVLLLLFIRLHINSRVHLGLLCNEEEGPAPLAALHDEGSAVEALRQGGAVLQAVVLHLRHGGGGGGARLLRAVP